ncbi:hypothetical protein Y1Q_0016457 [Alligator mississippiensis]|uniref:Ig-like domain-containing protein n=1 Tax=Alligator mississippiensis TaxID=8496 RepID=A0A151N2Q3_ALLMI|nr:hypothetical protein Y1Q_0016457 [Alligator mississippiensis]
MWMLPLWLWILFPGSVAVTGPRTVTGPEGGSVSVTCRYDKGYEENGKFWCREGSSFRCLNGEFILETNGSEAKVREGRFSIQDNHSLHVFTVSMEHLTKADAGTYHCGVLRTRLPDPRHPVEVIVSPVTKAEEEAEDYKIAVVLHCTGEKPLEIYNVQGMFADPNNKTLPETHETSTRQCLRHRFSIPTVEDVQKNVSGKQLYTILDEKDGYWQVKIG